MEYVSYYCKDIIRGTKEKVGKKGRGGFIQNSLDIPAKITIIDRKYCVCVSGFDIR